MTIEAESKTNLEWQLRADSVSHSVEDDIDGAWHDSAVPRHTLDGVRLARARCSVGEEQLVLTLQEVLHFRRHNLPKHLGLSTGRLEDLGE